MEMWRSQTNLKKFRLFVDNAMVLLWISGITIVYILVKPERQGFFCDDNSIRYPFMKEATGGEVIVSVTLATPIVMIFLTELFTRKFLRTKRLLQANGWKKDHPTFSDIVRAYMGYFWGYLVVTMLMLLLKNATAQLRPYFLDVCKPDVDLTTCRGYVTNYTCTNKQRTEKDFISARQSFPSGRSTYAAYMSVFIILYMDFRLRTHHYRLVKLTLYTAFVIYAVWYSATRVSVHLHHMRDVAAGLLLGLLLAVVAFVQVAKPSMNLGCNPAEFQQDVETGIFSHIFLNAATSQRVDDSASSISTLEESDENVNTSIATKSETEDPDTPTPLLSHGMNQNSNRAIELKASPFTLEGNKHKFARKSKSSLN